ncbi:MAG: glutathione S-transferase family protein [Roseateles sp.]|uniref:glutathione S-transferase family protein n=1 Tax=Roseateles sp. TaxID=1971397 RepID=UPI00403731EF
MHAFELISNHLCPYTQRAAIQLGEKGIAFERTYIDLADKPAWFLNLSPLGKVPVLRHGDTVVFESAVICEYIEEVSPAVPLLPAEPAARARDRAWVEFASALVGDIFAFYSAPDEASFERKRAELTGRFAALERQLGGGNYFDGDRFSLVDSALAPVFRLFDSFDRIADFGAFTGLPRLSAYRRRLAERVSVQRAVASDYGRRFEQYLATRGSHLSRLM